MKKIKGKLGKRTSQTQLEVNHHSTGDWTKYDERLIECVENGDFERLRATLSKKGTSAVKINQNGTTALHTACLVGNIDCLELLLKEQPDLSFVNKSGCSPLHVAAQAGNTECVQRILQHKVHVGSQDGKKMTALHHAAAKGHVECVELLMNNNAPLNGKDKDGRTPLLMAIQGAHENVAKLLLERGAKVNIADNSKKTALMYSSLLGLTKTVEILLKRGANSNLTDSNDHTAEDYARLCHYQGIIDLIHIAPSIATWDAGETSEDTEQEEDASIPNGEIVTEFSSLEESEADLSVTLHQRTVSNNVPSSVNSGSLSPQESFSSKASTTMSSPRAVNQDLTDDIKELEEENEMLNQELNKLRVQHQKTMERLRRLEDQQETKKSEATEAVITNHINGHIEEELLEEKDKRIGELEKEVENLKDCLKKETAAKNEAEAEVETLKVQVASYQDDDTGDFNSSDSDEDIDLPGVEHQLDTKKNNKMPKSASNQSEQLISLHGQITNLKLENETLKQQLKQQTVNGDFINSQNEPAIPLTVYQQLKESNEDEIFKLTEELEELKVRNEALEKSMAGKGDCLHCNHHRNKSPKFPSNNAEQVLLAELTNLKGRFEMAEIEHRDTVNMYRIQLLNACQGELDSDIQDALQMIIKLRSSEQFC